MARWNRARNPLNAEGSIKTLGGNDYVVIVRNDGWYACGYMYRVQYNGKTLHIHGGYGNDFLVGGTGADEIYGEQPGTGCDSGDANAGDDYLASGGGADTINGCDGDDIFDTNYPPGSGTVVLGGPGADCIEANSSVTVYCNVVGDDTDGMVDEFDPSASSTNCSVAVDVDSSVSNLSCY